MATLKISDLSVGDWVILPTWGDCPMRVYALYEDEKIGVSTSDSRDGIECFASDLEPISITAEILEKNGFTNCHKVVLGEDYEYNGEERVWDYGDISICEAKQGVFWHSVNNEYYLWRLMYVHQLQHLLRLYGYDKEINL